MEKNKFDIDKLKEYFRKHNILFKVNENPTNEEIEYIKTRIATIKCVMNRPCIHDYFIYKTYTENYWIFQSYVDYKCCRNCKKLIETKRKWRILWKKIF